MLFRKDLIPHGGNISGMRIELFAANCFEDGQNLTCGAGEPPVRDAVEVERARNGAPQLLQRLGNDIKSDQVICWVVHKSGRIDQNEWLSKVATEIHFDIISCALGRAFIFRNHDIVSEKRTSTMAQARSSWILIRS